MFRAQTNKSYIHHLSGVQFARTFQNCTNISLKLDVQNHYQLWLWDAFSLRGKHMSALRRAWSRTQIHKPSSLDDGVRSSIFSAYTCTYSDIDFGF